MASTLGDAETGHSEGTIAANNNGGSSSEAGEDEGRYQPLWVRLACIFLDFLTQIYDQIRIVPEIALFERSICYSYYSEHDPSVIGPGGLIPEMLCKDHLIQRELAHLRSWKAFYDGIAIFLTAIPMGILADRFGRKKIVGISILGPILSTSWILLVGMGGFGGGNIKLIWFSSVFFLLGNLSSANATIYAIAADSCPPSQRSRYFYYLYSTFLVCELFAPALASTTIDRNLLIPFAVGIFCLVLCYPVLACMPETHVFKNSSSISKSRRDSGSQDEVPDESDPLLSSSSSPPQRHSASSTPSIGKSFFSVLKESNILLALAVLLLGALRQGTVLVLLQYAAARFGWPMSRTAMLVSVIAAMNIVLFLFLLPQVIAFLTTVWRVPSQVIDYNVVLASLCILTVGSLLMGLAPSMDVLIPAVLLFATGYGTRVAVMSLLTVWTDENVRASTFGIAQIVEATGRMCGDPILLRIFGASLQLEGLLSGLPFFVASLGFGLGAVAWMFVRLHARYNG